MTDYTIVIHASGPTQTPTTDPNVRAHDADVLVTQFVRHLASEGHTVIMASVTMGKTDLLADEPPGGMPEGIQWP